MCSLWIKWKEQFIEKTDNLKIIKIRSKPELISAPRWSGEKNDRQKMEKNLDSEFEIEKKPPQKSTFVNVLAWIFIVLGGFTTFISTLQNIMIHAFFPKEEMNQAFHQAEQSEQIPEYVEFMLSNFDLFFTIFLIISVTTLISAIALLKRKNWARIVFIALMSLGIAWNVFGTVIQFTIFNSMPEFTGSEAPPAEFENMMQIIKISSVIMVIAISSLFGFIIKKLCSKRIRSEFV